MEWGLLLWARGVQWVGGGSAERQDVPPSFWQLEGRKEQKMCLWPEVGEKGEGVGVV